MTEEKKIYMIVYDNDYAECQREHVKTVNSLQEGLEILDDAQGRDTDHLLLIEGNIVKATDIPTWWG